MIFIATCSHVPTATLANLGRFDRRQLSHTTKKDCILPHATRSMGQVKAEGYLRLDKLFL